MKVVFPYIAQVHQILHSLPIAAELAMRHPHVQVRAACVTDEQADFIRRLLHRHAPDSHIQIDCLKNVLLRRVRYKRKRRLLLRNLAYLRSFDAIVTPERTSLLLRRFGLTRTKLIWSGHGAGDRAVGFASDIHQFDLVLMGGRKLEARLLAAGQVRPGCYITGIYPKLDWLRTQQPAQLFANDRPVVLYNPHSTPELSSWPAMGFGILDFFAEHPEWNLIFAPHVKLFDPPTAAKYRVFARYAELPNVRIDLGSEQCVDMTYLHAADLYLGDVSSQVVEFLNHPRPCVFLNAHSVRWRNDANYLFWHLGPVIESLDALEPTLHSAFAEHGKSAPAQRAYVHDSFGLVEGESSAARGADAVVAYLSTQRVAPASVRPRAVSQVIH